MTTTPAATRARAAVPRRRKPPRGLWVPNQHGAWAMLLAPLVSGALVGGWHWYQLPLGVLVVVGYLTFNAAIWWLKLPAVRRHQAVRPLAIYGTVTAAAGVAVLMLAGPAIAGWLPVVATPLVVALALAARKRERSTVSGLLTTFAAAGVALVAGAPDPVAWLIAPSWPVATAVGVNFAYFAGTVWSVKCMIRERGSAVFLGASIAWHAAATALAAIGAAAGVLTPFWAVFFAVTTLRAASLPAIARHRPVSPVQIGIIEIALTVVLLAGFAVWH